MKFLFLIAVLFSLSIVPTAHAENTDLTVCNHNVDRAIFVSYMNSVGAVGWQSNGWFKVVSNQCYDLSLGNYTGNVYVYAKDDSGQTDWTGDGVPYCVNSINAFQINNADTVACNGANQVKVASTTLAVKPGKNNWDVQPNFSQLNFCNQNATNSMFASLAHPVNGNLQSEGWFPIDPGKCKLVTVGKYTGPVYFYGESNGGQLAWTGTSTQFCVNRSAAFTLTNADQASSCTDASLKMVKAREIDVAVGTTNVNFEALNLDTNLQLCNKTSQALQASYATQTTGSALWASTGWVSLVPQQCASIDLSSYNGKVEIYAEFNQGQTYWGTGPFQFCVNRGQNFSLPDSTNQSTCNSNVSFKMVPATEFAVSPGSNVFNFNP